jgi:hypothetical protein
MSACRNSTNGTGESRLYDLEQSYVALSEQSQDGAIDAALLQGYYLDVVHAMRRVQAVWTPDERDSVTRSLLDLTQNCLNRADDAHKEWSGDTTVADSLGQRRVMDRL